MYPRNGIFTKDNKYFQFFNRFWRSEFNQNEKLSHNLVHRILYSKRLLVDHVDSLEQCLPMIEVISDSDVFSFYNTSLIVTSTIVQKFITPRSLRFTLLPISLFTSGFCCIYIAKKVSDVRLKFIEREIDKLINTIDKFGNCIKRNITYFNEVLVMKTVELIESRQIERAWDCMTSIKEVIDILYDATRKLEENYKLPHRFSDYYFPMEELRESDYFTCSVTEYNPKNIRDFYNIFAYVQSQFLLRLALTVSQDSTIDFLRNDISSIEMQLNQHVNEEEAHFMNLSLELKRKQQYETTLFHSQQAHPIKTGPVAVLQDSSLKLSACIIAVAEECQKLDIVLHKINVSTDQLIDGKKAKPIQNDGENILEIANSMRSIENSLSICCDDFNRLMLVYNKFLGSQLNVNHDKTIEKDLSNTECIEKPEKPFNVGQTEEEKHDDFYAYVYDENSESNHLRLYNQGNDYETTENYEKDNKNKFKPVLRQLKEKINPIRDKLLEKEKQILQAKGIDIDQLLDYKNSSISNDNDEHSSDTDSEGSFDKIDKQKIATKTNKFDEMRNFLTQKNPVNLFGGLLGKDINCNEEILE